MGARASFSRYGLLGFREARGTATPAAFKAPNSAEVSYRSVSFVLAYVAWHLFVQRPGKVIQLPVHDRFSKGSMVVKREADMSRRRPRG